MIARARIIATYRGTEYDAAIYLGLDEQLVSLHSERPTDGFAPVGERFVREVPLADCDALEYARPVGIYRDLPVAILDEQGAADELRVESLAHDAPAAAAAGLDRVERGVYRGWVPASQVRQQRLEIVDLTPSPPHPDGGFD